MQTAFASALRVIEELIVEMNVRVVARIPAVVTVSVSMTGRAPVPPQGGVQIAAFRVPALSGSKGTQLLAAATARARFQRFVNAIQSGEGLLAI